MLWILCFIIVIHFLLINSLYISGNGVFATKDIDKDEFLLEYRGEHILSREYNDSSGGLYPYYYKFNNKSYW